MAKTKNDSAFRDYLAEYDNYKKLGINTKETLTTFLDEKGIKFLSIGYRVKKLKEFIKKADRKKYEDPLAQMTDLCGVRIICFFQSDIEKIQKIIHKEFDVVEFSKDSSKTSPKEFGYRSSHFVVKLKKSWCYTPNYRGLENLLCEIQVRTVLMHAWAEIEHELAYKKTEHIPEQFRQRFNSLSATLKEVDGEFEKLSCDIEKYRHDVTRSLNKNKSKIGENKVLINLNSLQAFLDDRFPSEKADIRKTTILLDEFIEKGVDFDSLVSKSKKAERGHLEIEKGRDKKA